MLLKNFPTPAAPQYKYTAPTPNQNPLSKGVLGPRIRATEAAPDLFQQNGGWGGILGIPNMPAPGTYNLNTLLGVPKEPAPVIPQYSQGQANQSLINQLAGTINTGTTAPTNTTGIFSPNTGSTVAPLSPQNTLSNKKGSTSYRI